MKDVGLPLFGLFFVLGGAGVLAQGEPGLWRTVAGVATIAIGLGLWTRHPRSVRAYAIWAACTLLLGGWRELFVAGEPALVVAVWLVLMAALYGAVGLYLRSALRPQEA